MNQATSLLRLPVVKALTGLSKASIRRYEIAGEFPERVALGERAVAWREDEVREWINSRERRAGLNRSPASPVSNEAA